MSMSWEPQGRADFDALKGFDVYTSDGRKVGAVTGVFHPEGASSQAATGQYLRVEPGVWKSLIGTEELYVAASTIASVDHQAGVVHLDVAYDWVREQAWNLPADFRSFHQQ